jgi:hypothetical protein
MGLGHLITDTRIYRSSEIRSFILFFMVPHVIWISWNHEKNRFFVFFTDCRRFKHRKPTKFKTKIDIYLIINTTANKILDNEECDMEFPTQVVQKSAFWRRSILKPNPERVVKIPEPMRLVQNCKAVSTVQRPDFFLL